MKQFTLTLHTWEYRGDHSPDVQIAVAVDPTERIGDLVDRLLPDPREHLEVRLVWDKPAALDTKAGEGER